MLHTPSRLRTAKVPQVASDDNPYVLLASAVLARAVADARGEVLAPGQHSPAQIQQEARAWLAAETGPRDLVKLCGHDSTAVLARIRQVLQAPVSVSAASQLTLF